MGAGSAVADVELIVLALEALKKLGLEGVQLRVSHAGMIRALLGKLGLSPGEQARLFDQILDGDVAAIERVPVGETGPKAALSSLLDLKGKSAGFLKRISSSILRWVNSTGSLVASTVGSCLFFNITASDQYISIVVPGRMYAKTYREMGYKPELLSRTLEDSGTVTSVLIPWNTCGATQSGVLGVDTIAYLPYAFFNIISPFMTILFAYLNIKIRKITDTETKKPGQDRVDNMSD